MSQVSSTKKLLSASAVMASGTLVSRALGMLRVMLLAFIIGNGTRQADILDIATMVPNGLYILFAGGALNTVLVPQIVRAIKHDEDGGEAFTNRIITAFVLIVAAVAVVATLCAPLITRIYSSSAWRGPELAEQYASMVALTYLTLPQILFYGIFFLLAQVLNAKERFGPMMWAPIANNIISLLVLSTYLMIWGNGGDKSAAFTTQQILVLGIGSTLGIVTQALILLPFLRRIGFKLRPRFDLRGAGLGHTFSLTKWSLGFVAVNQLALIIVNRLATTATATGAGAGVNVYSNAHLLWILPHSLITTSLATAMLSSASRLAAEGDQYGVAQEMMKTARLALLFLVPAAAAFLALGLPISDLLLGYGRGAADASLVGWTLVMAAIGLVPFTVQFVCLRTYYALEDTRTPFLLQVGIASANAGLAVGLVWWVADPRWVAPMLALAYSAAYLLGVFVSWQFLRRKLPDLSGAELSLHIARLSIGAGVGGTGAYFLGRWLTDALNGSFWGNLLAVASGGVLILGTTVVVGKLLRVREMRRLSELVRGRLGRGSKVPRAAEVTPAVETNDPDPVEACEITKSAHYAAEIRAAVLAEEANEIADTGDLPPNVADYTDPSDDLEDPGDPDDGSPSWLPPDAPGPIPGGGQAATGTDVESASAAEATPPQSASSDEETAENTAVVDGRPPLGENGMVLAAGRYQLSKLLSARPDSETWLSFDNSLSRDVITHLVSSENSDAKRFRDAARRGARAMDSRFLRVLDFDRVSNESDIGFYIVCEHAIGSTLAELYSLEPFTRAEAIHVIREVAEALGPLHAQGLYHERLDPQHILITADGSVRIVGFGIAPVLEGIENERPWSQREADDVRALAATLRALQTGRWTPQDDDSADDYELADSWRAAFDGKATTMKEFVATLPVADSQSSLSSKMSLAARAAVDNKPPTKPALQPTPVPAPDDSVEEVAEPETQEDEKKKKEAATQENSAEVIFPRAEPKPRWALRIISVASLVTLLLSLLVVAVRFGAESRTEPVASPSGPRNSDGPSSAEAQPLTIASAHDFDPEADGGNGEENPALVGNAIDANPDTSWSTLTYLRRPNLGGLKPGVGLVLDLGANQQVRQVQLTLVGEGPTEVSILVPKTEQLSMRSVQDWQEAVPAQDLAAGTASLKFAEPTETQYLLVYLSSLPPKAEKFQGEIAEVAVIGE